jgi:hypothetical protein
MSESNWIGRVVLPSGRVATLGADGLWASADEDTARYLNGRFPPGEATGVAAVLPPGRGAVALAAATLGGRAEYREGLPALPPGAVS